MFGYLADQVEQHALWNRTKPVGKSPGCSAGDSQVRAGVFGADDWRSPCRDADIKTTAKFYADADLNDIRNGMEATAENINSQKKSQTNFSFQPKAMKGKRK